MEKKESNIKYLGYGIMIVFILLRIGYFVRMPYYAIGGSGYDDNYLLDLANSLMSGSWLGGYGMTTLIKGISFPLFVAFANWAGVSYPFLLAVFYLLSVGIFCFALYKLNHNKTMASAALFLLLYNPAGFSSKITQRLYRNGLMYPAVLLVFSCILLVYIYRKEEKYKQIFWLVLSGISFSFFYYIREDSIWLMPLFLVSLVVIAVWFWGFSGYSKKEKIKRTGCLMIPILIFAILSAGYSGKNYLAYGVWETNDRSGSNFAKLTGNMIKIKDESDAGLNYWISRDTLERIVDHCPSLSGDKEVYMEAYDERSGEGDDGNVRGDWSVWAIREAFNRLGYYESARKINDFCSVVNDELLRAVDNGVLEFDDAIHFTSQSRGIYAYEIADFVKETFKNIWDVATYKEAYALLEESTGDTEYVNFMESITGAGIIEESGSTLKLGGWIILKDDAQNTSIDLVDSEGNVISSVDRYQREDVYKTYPDYESALYSGFSMELDGAVDTETAYFRIYEGDELIDTVSVDTQEDEQVILCIDDNQIATDKKKEYSSHIVDISNFMIEIEKRIAVILFPLSIVLFVWLLYLYIKQRTWENFEPVIILLGVFLSMFLLEFGVTVFNSWLGAIWFYSIGVVPLAQAFEMLSLVYGMKSVRKFIGVKADSSI